MSSPAQKVTLPYQPPWLAFYPAVILFILFNYLILFCEVNSKGDDIVLSPYVADLKANMGSGDFSLPLYFEDVMLRQLLHLGLSIFGSLDNLHIVWVLVCILHSLEAGIAVRICLSCNATPMTFATYVLGTVAGGITQLSPLIGAKEEYRRRLERKNT